MERESFKNSIEDGVRAIEALLSESALNFMQDAAQMIADSLSERGKLLIAGNGGSLCDAMHFAEELTGYFRKKRPALPAIALADPGHISCVANDVGFDTVFSRGVEALGQKGDILVVLTTSGRSANIVQAVQTAKGLGLKTIAFLGKTGGPLKGECDLELIVEGFATSDRIQEAHMCAIHTIIEGVESLLYASPQKESAQVMP